MLAPSLSPHASHSAPDAPPATASTALAPRSFDPFDDDEEMGDWSEEDLVHVHWRLLQQVADLGDPDRSLEEKFDILHWIFTEPDKDDRPFSFAVCLRVVGCSPLSPIPYCGQVDVEEVRDRLRAKLKRWLGASLERYPDWVRQALATRPDWVIARLVRNPQWINEQVKRIRDEGDLFA